MSIFGWMEKSTNNSGTDNITEQTVREAINPEERCVNLAQAFSELTEELTRDFEISKGVLVVRMHDTDSLAAISTWKDGTMRDGLTVSLPANSSLFEKVAEGGSVYTEDFCDAFSGNFFERKLLLDSNSRSFVVQPLKAEGKVVGLLAYSSDQPTAFAMFEEGAGLPLASKFASQIESLMKQL